MNQASIITGATSTLYAVALSAALIGTAGMAAIMPTRRADLEPGFDFNWLIDLSKGRDDRKVDRKERMKAVQAKAVRGTAA